jgi:hypothetical protein
MQVVMQLPDLINQLFVNDVNNIAEFHLQSGVIDYNKIYRALNDDQENKMRMICKDLKRPDFIPLYYANVFEGFIPNWVELEIKHHKIDNIFNTYTKIGKIYKTIKNLCKIKDCNRRKIYLKIAYINHIKYSTYQIEMFFVLSNLLGCKRKVEIQDKLVNKKVIDWLNVYIEYLEWGNTFKDNNRPMLENNVNFNDEAAYHGKGCKCDCDTALKTQMLRFVYTFCCRDKDNLINKLTLISVQDNTKALCPTYLSLFYLYLVRMEKKYIKTSTPNKTFTNYIELLKKYKMREVFEVDDHNQMIQDILLSQVGLDKIKAVVDNFNTNESELGLLKKLVLKYIQECYYSSSKFWLASCIEVMVRGNNTFFQNFVASTGLIPCLLYDIIYFQTDQLQILQLSFDILGELIKFNKGNFFLLNYYFVDNNEYHVFTRKVISKDKLVDSNVFLRSIMLSYHFFNQEDLRLGIDKDRFFTNNCKLCQFISENMENIFYNLIQIIKPDDINQTNISCINTALLILIINHYNGRMAQFLNVNIY